MQPHTPARAHHRWLYRHRESGALARSILLSNRDRPFGLGGRPRRNWRSLRHRRLGHDVEKIWTTVVECCLNRPFYITWIGDLSSTETEPTGDRGVINGIEINAEVSIVVIEVLELLDPAKGAIRALDDDDRQTKPGNGLQLADRHAKAAVACHADHAPASPGVPGAHYTGDRVAESPVRAGDHRRSAGPAQ